MNEADKILNKATIDSKKERFIRYINNQKCPFRCCTDGTTMRYCDPDCMALVHNDDYNYICLRLINVNYQGNHINFFEMESED